MIVASIFRSGSYALIDKVLQGATKTEAIDETLDTCVLITYSTTYTFAIYDSVRIVVDDQVSYFLISDINVEERPNSQPKKTTLTLIEPTKYLEKIICPNISLTDKRYTLEDQIGLLLKNCELLRFGDSVRFTLSSALQTKLSGIPGEDFFFEKRTLRECLDDMLAVVGCRVEIYQITNFNNIVIDFYDLNEIIDTITFLTTLKKETVQNIEYTATDIEAYAVNTFSSDRDTIYHPSPKGWTTFKTKEALLTTSNATIQTAFPIEEIDEFVVKGDFTVNFIDEVEQPHNITIEYYDMIRNVVSKEIYDILGSTGGELITTSTLYQENTIYYVRETSEIQPQAVKVFLFFSASSITNAVKNAIYNSDEVQQYLIDNPTHNFGSITPNVTISNAMFRIKYQPYIDAHIRVGKRDYRDIKSTIINSQSDKTVDLKRFGMMLEENVNRLGNEEITIDDKVDDVSKLFEVGDAISNGYIITNRTISVYDNFIKCQYKMTKNYNAINQKIGIDRKRQIYNIPLEAFKVDNLAKYIISFSKTDIRDANYHELIDRSLDTVIALNNNKPITNVLIRTVLENDLIDVDLKTMLSSDITTNEGLELISLLYELPVVGYQIATSCLFSFKFEDNFSVGMSSEGSVVGGVKQTPNPYVSNNGEFHQIWLRLFNDANATRSTTYSIVKQIPRTYDSYFSGITHHLNESFVKIKDRYEHTGFTVQVEHMSLDDDVVITDYFAMYNALINDDKTTLSIVKGYSQYNRFSKKGIGSVSVDGDTIMFINGILVIGEFLETYTSVGIVDNDNNLIIGINKSSYDADVLVYTRCNYER